MKKMLLVSMFQNVAGILKAVEPNLKKKTVTYIPTASLVEKYGFFVRIGKWKLRRLGLVVEELDVSAASYETIKQALEKNDFIYITGGNTFFLLQELRKSGADQLLIDEIQNGKLYIGESAGAIVVAPNIAYSSKMDHAELAPELQDYSGLNLVNFYAVPHGQNWEFGATVQSIMKEYSTSLNLKVITDKQAILVEDDHVQILNK